MTERRFERSRFARVSSSQLSSERETLIEALNEQPHRSDEPEARSGRLDRALASARAELEARLEVLAEEVASSGRLAPDALRGLSDLWLVVHEPEFEQALRATVEKGGEPARSTEETAAEVEEVRWEIAVREAELVLRVAEEQLDKVGESLDPFLADQMVQQVLRKHSRDTDQLP